MHNALDHFCSRRSVVLARHGMVATSQPLAATAGLRILLDGGNAADAAVACAAALAVTEPMSTGLGGDAFALFYEAQTRAVTALNGSGRAPAALNLELLKRQGFVDELPPLHAHTITVPGACAAWCDLLARHGRMPLPAVLAPAIELAEQGFPVGAVTSHFWQQAVQEHTLNSAGGQELTLDGRAPRPGELIRLPTLARSLRAIAEGGRAAFYQGDIARQIAQTVQAHGGVMSVEDLAAHTSSWEIPISTTYRGVRVWECPPNGQGLTALIALNLLEGFDLKTLPPLSAPRFHLLIEALRVAFADTRWYVADPAFGQPPLDVLTSKTYADARRALMDPDHPNVNTTHGPADRLVGSDTVYMSVVDGEGNACSFINSLYMGFGTGIVPPGSGISLHNRGFLFSLDPAHPNALAPRKRPYHTIIPTMATYARDETLYACLGVMGGFMQPQGHVQVLVGMIDDDLDPQAALDRPRFCLTEASPTSQVALEEGLPPHTLASLAAMGHRTLYVSAYGRAVFGRGQIIRPDPHTGVLWGGSDPRADGQAVGW